MATPHSVRNLALAFSSERWQARTARARHLGEAVASLREQGLSYGQIALKLGMTRGQVAGHIYRHTEHEWLDNK